MKACFKCRRSLPLSEFYKHSEMADGHLGKCKDCAKSDVKLNREIRRDYYVVYERKRARLPHRKALTKKYQEEHREEINAYQRERLRANPLLREAKRVWTLNYRRANPRIQKAHNAAIRHHKDAPSRCELCGRTKVLERHHPDYDKPLEIQWLCKKCHCLADKQRKEKAL